MSKRRIVLVPHDPKWAELFARERAALVQACGGHVSAVHHIGSTAVPGLAAKPIIDILAVLRVPEDGPACIGILGRLGYDFRGANGIDQRFYFTKGSPRSHHLHMYPSDHSEVERHLRFRDYLRSHPDEAAAYADLKLQLAARFADDPEAYSTAKNEFCARVDQLAAASRHHRV
ncbi:GrpB family protein [Microvirga flocculans]|nr:GrpB family protein [Microvirga flocculans]